MGRPQTRECIDWRYSTEYTECQTFFPMSSELGPPHPQESVAPPCVQGGRQGGTLAYGGRGWGDPIPMMGQPLWYSRYAIIPLRDRHFSEYIVIIVFSDQLAEGGVRRPPPPFQSIYLLNPSYFAPSIPFPARLTRCSCLYSNRSPLYPSLWGRQPHTRKFTFGFFLLPFYVYSKYIHVSSVDANKLL